MATIELPRPVLHPPAPVTLEDSGLSADLIQQLVLKTLYFAGELTGLELSKRLGVAFSVFEPALEFLKQQRWCDISGGAAFGGASYRFRISETGRGHAHLSLQHNQYVGVAPVPLDQYRRYLTEFKQGVPVEMSRDKVRAAFSHMVVPDATLDAVGPAVNAAHSMFVYGEAGNGKTMLAQSIHSLLVNDIAIPHALEVEGYIIRVFNPANHVEIPLESSGDGLSVTTPFDRRWARCRRPLVMVGGELTTDALDLKYDGTRGFYKAPLQMMANGGILVIDDFGRQRCSPRELLNRWIVPLESRKDVLMLQSGQTFEVPFMVLLVLATNLKPTDLADEAFLRRIQYKIYAESPSRDDFIRIFENYCVTQNLVFDRAIVEHMLQNYYRPNKIALRGCQPRDLINQALALAAYLGRPAQLTPDLLDSACRTYFVNDRELPATYA
jgi:predicted ATPase with chaperone activity